LTSRRGFLRLALGGISALALAGCGQASGQVPGSAAATTPSSSARATKVTLGYFPNVTHAPALVGVAQDLFAKALPAVTLDYKTFNAGPALVEALFAGAIDAGYVGPSPAINGYVQSKGQALRIVSGAMSGGASLVVRPAAGIKSAQDLSGKKIASPQLGNTQDVALRFYLQQNGLKSRDKGGTVDVVPTDNPNIVNLFRQRQIDGAWVPEPWASTLVLQAGGDVLVDERTLWPAGRFTTVCIVASTNLLKAQPEIVRGILSANLTAVSLIGGDRQQAERLAGAQITRVTSQPMPADVLDRAFANQDATYDPLVSTIRAGADHAFALGLLGSAKPDIAGLFELGPLNDVLGNAAMARVSDT